MAVEDGHNGSLDELVDDLLFLALFDRLELDLAGECWDNVGQVAHPRHDVLLTDADRAPQSVCEEALVVGDRCSDGDARALVDIWAAPGKPRDLDDDLLHIVGYRDGVVVVGELGALLVHNADFVDGALRVVCPDLRAEAVPQRRDDAAAVGVVLWVRARDQEDVQLQAHTVAADLDVTLLHDVEETNLDAFREVGQLINAEDAAVRPRDQAVVDR